VGAQEESGPEPTIGAAAAPPERSENEEIDSTPAGERESDSLGDPGSETGSEPEEISVAAADGLSLVGTFYHAQGGDDMPSPGVLLLHMNGGRRQDWSEVAGALAELGYSVLSLDMRGHGQTGGTKDWGLAADDLQRVWRYLVDREEVDEDRTAVVGASIGANMALTTGAAVPSVQTVVLLSPGLDYFGVTTENKIIEYGSRPVMIVASEEDAYAAQSSKTLDELAQGEAELVMYEGAGHGTRMFSAQPELLDLIVEWLGQHLASSADLSGESKVESRGYPLFDVAWDDRSIFEKGLVESDKEIVQQLAGAPVYHLDLDFSKDMSALNGLMQMRYTNMEDTPFEELFFHLYPNRLGGKMTIGQVRAGGQAVNPEYMASNTVMAVPLPDPLSPGQNIVVDLDYTLEIPSDSEANFGLLTASDAALALAHFYPQLAVYDRDGWNINIPPGIPDMTFADSAYYLVRVSAPGDQQLIGSGLRVSGEAEG
jgi:pimeloyl-ACP methyl ester carboxylesterase